MTQGTIEHATQILVVYVELLEIPFEETTHHSNSPNSQKLKKTIFTKAISLNPKITSMQLFVE